MTSITPVLVNTIDVSLLDNDDNDNDNDNDNEIILLT